MPQSYHNVTFSPHDCNGIALCVKASYRLGSLETMGEGMGPGLVDFYFKILFFKYIFLYSSLPFLLPKYWCFALL